MAERSAGSRFDHIVVRQPQSADTGQAHPLANWMSLHAQGRRIDQLVLPGTHDSGCYEQFSLQRNCFDESRGLRTAHTFGARTLAKRIANRWARTQHVPIYRQLRMGVRCLDLRVALDARTENYHIVHTFTGPCVSELLEDIKRFLEECPREVVVLYVVPKGGLDNRRLISYLVDDLGPHLHRNLHNGEMYLTVGQMVSAGERVVLVYEHGEPFSCDSVHIPADHKLMLWDSGLLHGPFFDTDSPQKKCDLQHEELRTFVRSKSEELGSHNETDATPLLRAQHSTPTRKPDRRMFQLTFTLTPQPRTVVADSACCCLWNTLEALATGMNAQLNRFIDRLSREELSAINIVSVDFADEETVHTIIQLNTRMPTE